MGRRCLLAACALALGSTGAAASVETFACKELSGGHAAAFTLTVDDRDKTLGVSSSSWFQPLPESEKITPAVVSWTFMRGYASLDRKSHVLDWDDTGEYDYLSAIGQPSDTPRASYAGRMRCEPR